jgi:recA bacterial DNA recombination protein
MAVPDESLPPPGRGRRGIDLLLGAFSPGQLSEIVGPWSSGGGSLLLALLARATAAGQQVALVDGADSFDPDSAVRAGVDLSRLLWVRCGNRLRAAFSSADLLARCPGIALVALDLGEGALIRREPIPPALCLRLKMAAEQSATALVLRAPRRLAGSVAALVVSMERLEPRWVGWPHPTRLAGLGTEARITRARVHPGFRAETRWTIEWRL